jgi:hypothetical protein
MKLVLRSARRLEREIEAEVNMAVHVASARGGINVSIYESFDDTIATAQSTITKSIDTAFRLSEIRAKIRKMIETENEVSGVNRLMNEEAVLKVKSKVLTQVMGAELTPADRKIALERHRAQVASGAVQNAYGQTTDTVAVSHVMEKATLDLFKAQAKDVQRRMLKIVDEITALNTSRTIEIGAEDVAFLEANNFVL